MAYWQPNSLMTLAVCFMNLSSILVLLRFVTVRLKKQRVSLDDLALAASWVFNLAIEVNLITAVAYGVAGRPIQPSGDIDGVPELTKFYYVQEIALPLQLAFSKLSIVFFYRRTLVATRQGFTHWATMTTIALVSLWGVSFTLSNTFQCGSHFSYIWGGTLAEELQFCVSAYMDLAFASTDLLLDLIIVVLPLHRIFTLQLSLSKKMQVSGTFMLGALSVAGAAVRLAVFMSEFLGVHNSFITSDESTLASIIMYWGTFEAGFAITTASLPGLRPLLNLALDTFGNTWSTMQETRSSEASTELEGTSGILVHKDIEVRVSTIEV